MLTLLIFLFIFVMYVKDIYMISGARIIDSMPAGIIITDTRLRIKHINAFAMDHLFRLNPDDAPDPVLSGERFLTIDRQVFNMHGCMENMVSDGKRTFSKTLILRNQMGELLVHLSVKQFSPSEDARYLFVITDISDEMDCVTHSPDGFSGKEYVLAKTIIGKDQKIRDVYRKILLAADSMANLMITGESGTGKEMAADAIHRLSERKKNPYVKVNCASLSESLLESELFGHVKGAFTGATSNKTGKIEEAHKGTLFLDEVGEISAGLQVKLLRVIQEKTIERVGDNRPIKVDMRIIAATNRDLYELVKEGKFREDLYYRLNVFSIHMPPLRERPLDIPLLCNHFVDRFNYLTGKQVKGLDNEAMRLLMDHYWPGNVRELRNAIEHAFVLVQSSLIGVYDLPPNLFKHEDSGATEPDEAKKAAQQGERQLFRKTRGGRLPISREKLQQVLEQHDWNQTQAAEYLGISRVGLWKKIRKFEL